MILNCFAQKTKQNLKIFGIESEWTRESFYSTLRPLNAHNMQELGQTDSKNQKWNPRKDTNTGLITYYVPGCLNRKVVLAPGIWIWSRYTDMTCKYIHHCVKQLTKCQG